MKRQPANGRKERPKTHTVDLRIRMPPGLKAEIEAAAGQDDRDVSSWARRALKAAADQSLKLKKR